MNEMPGIVLAVMPMNENTLAEINERTREWEMRAARGECAWVCCDCGMSFPEGMPSACEHGHAGCTRIIERDKAQARA